MQRKKTKQQHNNNSNVAFAADGAYDRGYSSSSSHNPYAANDTRFAAYNAGHIQHKKDKKTYS